ncbi:hypothetical protein [Burkholderia ubonensis]|uniref:hypothetical protein n=1 Tax=Burkholderia ubonensis TaxID=101571 RepID=UPI000A4C12E2|nr:hypothetical protein [Burkholderia ubonensis]
MRLLALREVYICGFDECSRAKIYRISPIRSVGTRQEIGGYNSSTKNSDEAIFDGNDPASELKFDQRYRAQMTGRPAVDPTVAAAMFALVRPRHDTNANAPSDDEAAEVSGD